MTRLGERPRPWCSWKRQDRRRGDWKSGRSAWLSDGTVAIGLRARRSQRRRSMIGAKMRSAVVHADGTGTVNECDEAREPAGFIHPAPLLHGRSPSALRVGNRRVKRLLSPSAARASGMLHMLCRLPLAAVVVGGLTQPGGLGSSRRYARMRRDSSIQCQSRPRAACSEAQTIRRRRMPALR